MFYFYLLLGNRIFEKNFTKLLKTKKKTNGNWFYFLIESSCLFNTLKQVFGRCFLITLIISLCLSFFENFCVHYVQHLCICTRKSIYIYIIWCKYNIFFLKNTTGGTKQLKSSFFYFWNVCSKIISIFLMLVFEKYN